MTKRQKNEFWQFSKIYLLGQTRVAAGMGPARAARGAPKFGTMTTPCGQLASSSFGWRSFCLLRPTTFPRRRRLREPSAQASAAAENAATFFVPGNTEKSQSRQRTTSLLLSRAWLFWAHFWAPENRQNLRSRRRAAAQKVRRFCLFVATPSPQKVDTRSTKTRRKGPPANC